MKDLKQWADVKTVLGAIKEPPQDIKFPLCSATYQGYL